MKFAGISAVVADSFARIFYRNALNIGLLAIPIPGISRDTTAGDIFQIDVYRGLLRNKSTGREYGFPPFEDFIMEMLEEGGIISYTMKCLRAEAAARPEPEAEQQL